MSFCLDFGKHIDKTLDQIAEEDPEYLLWLDGSIVNKFSLSKNGRAMHQKLAVEHADSLAVVKTYVQEHSSKIKHGLEAKKKVVEARVLASSPSRKYHYHPFGKRD